MYPSTAMQIDDDKFAGRNGSGSLRETVEYWFGLPLRWGYQIFHNGKGIVCVLDLTKFRPLPGGLLKIDHPWVTGANPRTMTSIWPENVIYRTPRASNLDHDVSDDRILHANGRFLAERVRQSCVVPELPVGPKRRMPHAINYLHGVSHYNSGIILLNDFREAYEHINDWRFRKELHRFVALEKREVLFLFRNRNYSVRDYAYLSCCMRSVFPWFCNPNGPKEKVLWGNYAPFPAANLITGNWVRDLYSLKRVGGAHLVIKPPISKSEYFQDGCYGGGRAGPRFPEKWLAHITNRRVRLRGTRGGMFFLDRRKVYADQIQSKELQGESDQPQARL